MMWGQPHSAVPVHVAADAFVRRHYCTRNKACVSSDPASDASIATGIATTPMRKKSQKLTSTFSPQRDQPQDRCERAGDGQVGPEVHPNQNRIRDRTARVRDMQGASGDEADGKVVHEIICHSDAESRYQLARDRSQAL